MQAKKVKLPLLLMGILALLIVGAGVFFALSVSKVRVQELYVTNLKDTGATIVYTTNKPVKGSVIVDKIGKFFDDRAIFEEGIGEYKYSEDKDTSKFIHHISIRNLQPETEYKFKVKNSLLAESQKDYKFMTTGILESIASPDPTYGRVIDENGDAITEGVVLLDKSLYGTENKSQKISSYISQGSYSIDTSNVYVEDMKTLFVKEAGVQENVLVLGRVGDEVQKLEHSFDLDKKQPVDDLILKSQSDKIDLEASKLSLSVFAQSCVCDCKQEGTDVVFFKNAYCRRLSAGEIKSKDDGTCYQTEVHCNALASEDELSCEKPDHKYEEVVVVDCPSSILLDDVEQGVKLTSGGETNWAYDFNNPNRIRVEASECPRDSCESGDRCPNIIDGECSCNGVENAIVSGQLCTDAIGSQSIQSPSVKQEADAFLATSNLVSDNTPAKPLPLDMDDPTITELCPSTKCEHEGKCFGLREQVIVPSSQDGMLPGLLECRFVNGQYRMMTVPVIGISPRYASPAVPCHVEVEQVSGVDFCHDALCQGTDLGDGKYSNKLDESLLPHPDFKSGDCSSAGFTRQCNNDFWYAQGEDCDQHLRMVNNPKECHVLTRVRGVDLCTDAKGVGRCSAPDYYDFEEGSCETNGYQHLCTDNSYTRNLLECESIKVPPRDRLSLQGFFFKTVSAQEEFGASSSLDPGFYTIEGGDATTKTLEILEEGTVRYFSDLNFDGVKQEDEPYIEDLEGFDIRIKRESDVLPYFFKIGWNVFSVPMVLQSEGISQIQKASEMILELNRQGAVVTNISTYRNGKFLNLTLREDADDAVYGGDFSILPGEAYFVKNYKNADITLIGNKVEGALEVPIQAGWNLIGIYNETQKSYSGFEVVKQMNTATLEVDVLSKWESGMYQNIIIRGGEEYGNDFEVYSTFGYWVRSNTSQTGKFKPE
jgi:hypothetical protein